MLQEPYLVGQEGGGLCVEATKFFLGASAGHSLGETEIQAEHTHKILAVDILAVVAHPDLEGLTGCQRHKGLYLFKCS